MSTIPSETQSTACFWMSRIASTRSTRGSGSTGDLGDEDHVGLAVGGPQGDHPAVAAHDLDDRDPAVALGRGPDPLDADRRDVDGRGVAGGRVVDHLVEVEVAPGLLLVDVAPGRVRAGSRTHSLGSSG